MFLFFQGQYVLSWLQVNFSTTRALIIKFIFKLGEQPYAFWKMLGFT